MVIDYAILFRWAMSVEVHAFFRGKLPDKLALARALRELGFPLRFNPPKGSLEGHSGFLPMTWDGDETGFEFEVISDPEGFDECRVDGVDPTLDRCAVFRVGGDMTELFAAQAGASALAKLTGGTVYDPEGGRVRSLDEAIADARGTLDLIAGSRKRHPRGTRPADIRHYLKPLLKERRDLVLQGRHLFIRSARHFLRGVWLSREDQYALTVSLYFQRLHRPAQAAGVRKLVANYLYVWQPHFEPWLFDTLEYSFEEAQKVTSLSAIADQDLRDFLPTRSIFRNCLIDYLLAGERELAEALVLRAENSGDRVWGNEQRALFERDIEQLCAECHAQQARTAQIFKLGVAWQPTPFPVEVAKPARPSLTYELPFSPVKWPGLVEEITQPAPRAPGEIVFCREWTNRNGSILAIVPLTRDQAHAVHDNHEGYTMFARLAGGELLILDRDTYPSPRDPAQPQNPDSRVQRFVLRLRGERTELFAHFSDQYAETGTIDIDHARLINLDGKDYRVDIDLTGGTWRPARNREKHFPDPLITEAERALMRIPVPQFGEYEDFPALANKLLEHGGAEKFQLGADT
jgi:hypothetical protein